MRNEPQERSLNELIEIAKRAQSILGHLDLEAIASHDPDAVAKLASVANAIQALDDGEDVGFIPGIDENVSSGPPVLDPRQVRRSELMELLDKAGYSNRLGRIYVEPSDTPGKTARIRRAPGRPAAVRHLPRAGLQPRRRRPRHLHFEPRCVLGDGAETDRRKPLARAAQRAVRKRSGTDRHGATLHRPTGRRRGVTAARDGQAPHLRLI